MDFASAASAIRHCVGLFDRVPSRAVAPYPDGISRKRDFVSNRRGDAASHPHRRTNRVHALGAGQVVEKGDPRASDRFCGEQSSTVRAVTTQPADGATRIFPKRLGSCPALSRSAVAADHCGLAVVQHAAGAGHRLRGSENARQRMA